MFWESILRGTLDVLGSVFVQLIFTVGAFLLYGGFISLCNRFFYDACGDKAFWIVRVTGYIGTPIHELSHALMCLLFGHTIQKISLFGDSKKSKTLGYVEHTYYRSNLYHQIGNFFIGISPILAGGGVILLLVRFLTPSLFGALYGETMAIGQSISGFDGSTILSLFDSLFNILIALFSWKMLTNWRWWICMVLVFSIAIHMEISRSDIRSGLKGLGVISVLFLVADMILKVLFDQYGALSAFTSICFRFGIFMAVFMIIPAVFSALIGFASLMGILVREATKSIDNDRVAPVTNHHTVHGHKKTAQHKKERKK